MTLLEQLRATPFYVSIIEATINGPKPVLYHYVDFENTVVANVETRECIACISCVEESSDHKEVILTFLFQDDVTIKLLFKEPSKKVRDSGYMAKVLITSSLGKTTAWAQSVIA